MSVSLALAALPLLVLGLVAFNLVFWPRRAIAKASADADANDSHVGGVSVCVPARNEEGGIEACVEGALAAGADEVVVVDDGSSDGTPALLRALAARHPALKVVRNDDALPPGWVGKPRACARLADEARGDALVFVDADVVLRDGAVSALRALQRAYGADLVTAVPRQRAVTLAEQLVVPLLHQTYTSWLPLPLIWRSRDERFLAANGQILLVERAALARLGGFAAVKADIVDDMALCRAAKRAGLRVLFVDGDALGDCRMYKSAAEVVAGFSKNIHAGVGSVVGVFVAIALYLAAFVVPVVALAAGVVGGGVTTGVVVAAAAAVVARALVWARFRQPLSSLLLFPLGVVVLCGIALNSLRWTLRGRIEWKGRSYAPASGGHTGAR